ncbi:MAG: ATP-binding protein [Proteobacteria bacterium]|nr:ATP-binding protein [Pseudomonadota bacterium]
MAWAVATLIIFIQALLIGALWFGKGRRPGVEAEAQTLLAAAEKQLALCSQRLELTHQELAALSYSISHDLRAPLRGIDGWSLALLEDYGSQLDPTARQYLDQVRAESKRLTQMIEALLALSRVTRDPSDWRRVDLSQLALRIVERLRLAYPGRPMEFRIQPGMLAQGAPAEGPQVYCIRDNGAGFDMAYAQKLFGAFQRMHKVTEFSGIGIGLATVKRIVNAHGGRIWAEAQTGHGASFRFTLGEAG